MGYEVVVTRDADNWLAGVPGVPSVPSVPSVPGAHTYARSLATLMDGIRDAIILT